MLISTVALVAAAVVATGEEENPPMLTPEQFHSLKDPHFVKFFSPYCPHCRALEPKWNAAYQDVGGQETRGFKWASVNCVEQGDLCSEENVSWYPTLRVYDGTKRVYDYSNSGASQADLRAFAERYAADGAAAFSKEFEVAPKEVVDREKADEVAEKAEKDKQENTEEAKEKQEAWKNTAAEQAVKDNASIKQEDKDSATDAALKAQANSHDMKGGRDGHGGHDNTNPNKDIGHNGEPNKVGDSSSSSDDSSSSGSEEYQSTDQVTALHAGDFGPNKNVGRWFVLFTGENCQNCDSLGAKWENHDNFARDVEGINWGRVDCAANPLVCEREEVFAFPVLRMYQDGLLRFNYEGSTDSMALRKFVLYASTATTFDNFSLNDLENPNTQPEGNLNAGPNREPNYLSGPAVAKPNYGNDKPKVSEVVEYTLSTLGQPIDEDPGKLIFGDSPEAHHNFRTWGAPDAPPPAYMPPGTSASYADGTVHELKGKGLQNQLETVVKAGSEPWLLKFYSPRCPHCTAMAPAYQELALRSKDKLNIGSVNCDNYPKVCDAEGVDHWPYITLYRGPFPLEEFEGERTADNLMAYAERAWGAQISPIESEEELSRQIVTNMDRNLTTFVYLYDQSVMAEDWESLSQVALNIDKWGGRLYRSNSPQLRELAGIKHRGSAFVNVDIVGEPGEGTLKWYDYPWSNLPKKIRDSKDVEAWAYRAKYTIIQYLDPIAQTRFSPYVAIVLTEGSTLPSEDSVVLKHKQKALEHRDFYRERQIEDEDRMRIDRLSQHDAALLESKFTYARKIMKQRIDVPLFADLAFAYIPHTRWFKEFSPYLDVAKHEVGHVIIVDFYNGVYLDEFNKRPIKDDKEVLDDSIELLHRYEVQDPRTSFNTLRMFKKTMRGVPEPLHRSTHFHLNRQSGLTFVGSLVAFGKFVLVIVSIYLVYSKFGQPCLREHSARRTQVRGWSNNE